LASNLLNGVIPLSSLISSIESKIGAAHGYEIKKGSLGDPPLLGRKLESEYLVEVQF